MTDFSQSKPGLLKCSIRAYLATPKIKVFTEFNLKISLELSGEVG